MDFELSADQQLLSRTALEFVAKKSPVARARRLREQPLGFEPTIWREMAALGWLGLPFAEEVGGYGSSFLELGVLLEQFGKELVCEPYVPSVVLAGTALAHGGSQAQQQRFLAPMVEGKTTLALAYTERDSRFELLKPHTSAQHQGAGFILHGEKLWVQNGQAADHFVVSARMDDKLELFVIDRGQKGLHVQPLDTFDGRKAGSLKLDGVYAEPERRLTAAPADHVLELAIDRGATAAVAEGVGITQRVLDMTVDYLKTREQFDVKIGTFQVLQHRAVDMFTETQLLRSIALKALVEVDNPDAAMRRRAVSAAKVQLSLAGKLVTRQAIQLHGGIGCTDEHDLGLYFKRMQVLNTLYGDEEHHVARFAREPGFEP